MVVGLKAGDQLLHLLVGPFPRYQDRIGGGDDDHVLDAERRDSGPSLRT
jgi:hypothetical protein